jgi:lysophospholipase L1-like esterase
VLTIYLVGESTVAGVGARSHEHGLSGQLARRLAEALSRPVRWEALGLTGARARDCLEGQVELELVPRMRARPSDLIVVVLGVNDTTKLTSRASWRRAIRDIVSRCRRETSCPIVFTGVPPVHRFTALAWPLRSVVGARARLLDDDLRRIAEAAAGCHHLAINVDLKGDDLAADGFHPSERGYARWADELALQAARALEP